MTNKRYRMLKGEPLEFTADSDAAFLSCLRKATISSKSDDRAFLRERAMSDCEYFGVSVDFSDVPSYINSLVRNGIMEVTDARA